MHNYITLIGFFAVCFLVCCLYIEFTYTDSD